MSAPTGFTDHPVLEIIAFLALKNGGEFRITEEEWDGFFDGDTEYDLSIIKEDGGSATLFRVERSVPD